MSFGRIKILLFKILSHYYVLTLLIIKQNLTELVDTDRENQSINKHPHIYTASYRKLKSISEKYQRQNGSSCSFCSVLAQFSFVSEPNVSRLTQQSKHKHYRSFHGSGQGSGKTVVLVQDCTDSVTGNTKQHSKS